MFSHSVYADHEGLPDLIRMRLALLVDKLHDGIVLINSDWRIVYANPMAFTLSQLTLDDINGGTIWDIFPTIVGSEIGHAYLHAAATGEEKHIYHYISARLRSSFEIHIYPTPQGICVHYRDITNSAAAPPPTEP